MHDERFVQDAEEFYLRCFRNGIISKNVDLWFDFVVESLVPGARERLIRQAKVTKYQGDEQLQKLKETIAAQPGVLLVINTTQDFLHVDLAKLFELLRSSVITA